MACINAPMIVAEGSQTAVTTSLSSTTIFTTSAAGFFRFNGLIFQQSTNANINGYVAWTDSLGIAHNYQMSAYGWSSSGTNAYSFGTPLLFYCEASTTISISTTITSGTASYDYWYVLESL